MVLLKLGKGPSIYKLRLRPSFPDTMAVACSIIAAAPLSRQGLLPLSDLIRCQTTFPVAPNGEYPSPTPLGPLDSAGQFSNCRLFFLVSDGVHPYHFVWNDWLWFHWLFPPSIFSG